MNRKSKILKYILLAILLLLVAIIFFKGRDRVSNLPPSSYVAGEYNESIKTKDNRTRTFTLYVPKEFDAEDEYPLILLFHGGNGNGEKILDQTDFRFAADEHDFIVVAPDGVDNNWADGRATTEPDIKGVDDVAFIRELVVHISSKLPIHDNRVYATGASNGGIFTFRLACEASDLIRAAAPVIASLPSNIAPNCDPEPIPIQVIQGTSDPFIPIEGGDSSHERIKVGDGGLVESVENTRRLFAQNNKCNVVPETALLPTQVNDGTQVLKLKYEGCANNADVIYYIVRGMGHSWPPKSPTAERLSGPTSRNIDATEVISDFFKTH
ncbi:MAG: alpha/beta hydrolase-fold protein [Candidatus Paceibacterota bacterium]